jgi:purine-binding chemotaxis protein CheW
VRTNLQATENEADVRGQARWLLCRAGTSLCAVPLDHVAETMRVPVIQPVAGAPHYVLGLCVVRGSPVPVVDTGLLVSDQATRRGRLVAIRAGNRTIALAVEAVLGIRTIAEEALSRLPPLLRDAATETVTAIGMVDAELLFVLRTGRIVPDDLLDHLDVERAAS